MSTIKKIRFLCDKFGWRIRRESGVNRLHVFNGGVLICSVWEVGHNGLEIFATHAMCEAQSHGQFIKVDLDNQWVTIPQEDYKVNEPIQDPTPLGLSTAIIEALYRALGGE